jgi:hypothetical protein
MVSWPQKYRGREPSHATEQFVLIKELSQQSVGNNEVARQVGLSEFAVSRTLKDVVSTYRKLNKWRVVE